MNLEQEKVKWKNAPVKPFVYVEITNPPGLMAVPLDEIEKKEEEKNASTAK